MSEMRRAARSLVEPRTARFTASPSLDESILRLRKVFSSLAGIGGEVSAEGAIAWEKAHPRGLTAGRFEGRWVAEEAGTALEGRFVPSPRLPAFLRAASGLLTLLLLADAWLLVTMPPEDALRFLLPLTTVLAILGFPFVVLGFASHKQASEARIEKAIRTAFQDEAAL